jgi:hypothetical protein
LTEYEGKGRLSKIQLDIVHNQKAIMRPSDTSRSAETIQIETLRRMGAARRLQAGIDLSQSSRRLLLEGVRKRHPEYSEREANLAVIRLTLPADLFLTAYPEAESVLP